MGEVIDLYKYRSRPSKPIQPPWWACGLFRSVMALAIFVAGIVMIASAQLKDADMFLVSLGLMIACAVMMFVSIEVECNANMRELERQYEDAREVA